MNTPSGSGSVSVSDKVPLKCMVTLPMMLGMGLGPILEGDH